MKCETFDSAKCNEEAGHLFRKCFICHSYTVDKKIFFCTLKISRIDIVQRRWMCWTRPGRDRNFHRSNPTHGMESRREIGLEMKI